MRFFIFQKKEEEEDGNTLNNNNNNIKKGGSSGSIHSIPLHLKMIETRVVLTRCKVHTTPCIRAAISLYSLNSPSIGIYRCKDNKKNEFNSSI